MLATTRHSGQDIMQAGVSGCGTRHGTTAVTDGMIPGITVLGTDRTTDSTAHGITAGTTIPGTMDGIRLTTTARGDGLTTDTTDGARLTGITDIMATTEAEVDAVTTTGALAMQVL